jgi:two-component system, sensor histidine kinase
MKRWPVFSSVRGALIFIVLLSMIPVLFIIVWTGIEHGTHLEYQVTSEAIRQTEALAEIQLRITESTRQLMVSVATMISSGMASPDRLNVLLASLLERNPELLNITITNAAGIVTHSAKLESGVDLSDRRHIRNVIRAQRFSSGEYILGKVDDIPSFPFSLPLTGEDGILTAIVTCTYMLSSYQPVFEQLKLPEETVLGIIDHNGTRLFFHPPKDSNPIGQKIKSDVWQEIVSGPEAGTTLQIGSDGIRRFYSYRKLRHAPAEEPYMYIVLAIPEAVATRPSTIVLFRNLGLMALLLVINLVMANFLSEVLVGQRVHALTEAASRIQKGILGSHVDIPDDGSELSLVGKAMDRMAETLEQQAEERRIAAGQLRKSLNEKETLLKEIHHRVKNNLQLILSLIRLQAEDPGTALEFSQRLEGRVRAMSLIHELLYESDNLAALDMADYIPRLAGLQFHASERTKAPRMDLLIDSVWLGMDQAIPLALILNELVSNAFKHAGDENGRISIKLSSAAKTVRLTVSDDGNGLSEGFDPMAGTSLGMKLAEALALQIGGNLSWTNRNGAEFTVQFDIRQP